MSKVSGQLIWRGARPYVRIRLGDGKRPRFRIACTSRPAAEKRAVAVSDLVRSLQEAGKDAFVEEMARRAAAARLSSDLEGVRIAVRAVVAETVTARPQFSDAITFEDFATKWTSGELHRLYPKRIKKKKSAEADAGTLRKWVFPHIGSLPLAAITYDNCDDVLEALPDQSVYLTRQVAQAIARVMRLAFFPARLITQCPIPRGFVPPIIERRARTYVFPMEERALLRCSTIHLVKRLLYGVLTREGMRVSEALSLDVADLDLMNGAVNLDRNKTDDPRTWALDPNVAEALRLWLRYFHPDKPEPTGRVFMLPPTKRWPSRPLEARRSARADELRADLMKAGCTRPQLYEHNDKRRRVRVHDLRATFVTVSLATNKTEGWISARTGHTTSKMINDYRRMASCHQELDMRPLVPLTEAIPELAALMGSAADAAAE